MGDVYYRASCQGKLKKYLATVKDHKNAPLTYHEAIELRRLIQYTFDKHEEVQERLIKTCKDDAALKVQFNEGNNGEEAYFEATSLLRVIIETLDPAGTTSSAASGPTVSNIRLPAIELPKFSGEITEWCSSKDLFTAAVAGNAHLGGAQKLQYLKSSVQGEPAELIKSLATTDCNYAVAWKLLLDRYDNDRDIVFALVKKLLTVKTVNHESSTELQSLVDVFEETTRALKVLKRPVDEWSDILVVLMSMRIDGVTRRDWAITLKGSTIPTYSEFIAFLNAHIRGLKSAEGNGVQPSDRKSQRHVKVHTTATRTASCPVCGGSHSTWKCEELKRKSVKERMDIVRSKRLCFNCLGKHMISMCKWNGSCRKCNRKHHVLLHHDPQHESSGTSKSPATGTNVSTTVGNVGHEKPESVAVVATHHASLEPAEVLMTAIVNVVDRYGRRKPYRLLVDNGSGPNLMTEETICSLGLHRKKTNVVVSGVCGVEAGPSRGIVEATVESRVDCKRAITAEFHVMKQITGTVPGGAVERKKWRHLDGLELADPTWDKPGKIDIMLGVRHFDNILLYQRRRCDKNVKNAPVAWESIFGWLVAGPCSQREGRTLHSFHVTVDPTTEILRRYFDCEEIPEGKVLSKEETECEKHFVDNFSRDERTGRFTCAVPFNEKKALLGGTRAAAVQRFLQVERRMQRDSNYKEKYTAFMKEYLELGHMVKIPDNEDKEVIGRTAHLPHHGVINNSSSTTKLRVVFDGSQMSTTGISLNQTMMVGATVQDELYNLLLRFRLNEVVLKADITKMFCQFQIRDQDADYHRIVWRNSPSEELADYKLTTVTYGTACAPFLATRCLHQLALDEAERFPAASSVLLNNTYVDDTLPSVSTAKEAINLYDELTAATKSACLELRKWTSNNPAVLAVIPEEIRESEPLSFDEDSTVKALGVQWHPMEDVFKFKGIEFQHENQLTKRKLLSDAARVFDPLGLISCFSVRAKMLLQELWKSEVGWDDKAPQHVVDQWTDYKRDIELLVDLKIPRRVVAGDNCEIHAFSDSSERALGCAVYIRHFNGDGTITVSFVTSKTKVAPVKLVTLPRLELDAAVMAAKLVKRVKHALNLTCRVYLWTDSTITLKWIQGSPSRWKTFVGNRVSTIQKLSEVESWRHVPGTDNPADLASRGVPARDLLESNFWWKGPAWLSEPGLPAFTSIGEVGGDLEERAVVVKVHHASYCMDLLGRFSTLSRLKRVSAFMMRFIRRKQWERRSKTGETTHKWVSDRGEGPLSASELQYALEFWICKVQRDYFADDIKSLEKEKKVKVNSKLRNLSPYLDNVGILRVSGRLVNSGLPTNSRNQIILPASSHLTYLLIHNMHKAWLHGGFTVTWAGLLKDYWIIGGRDKVRHLIRSCVTCRRHRGTVANQMMGNLPAARVTPSRPFLHTGVDYAGPFTLKNPVGRVPKTYKGFMCLFVCMSTKAIHLEAVSSLSTEAFLETLRRFVSRRGLCAHVYSDCGTNFVGAEKELRKLVTTGDMDGAVAGELSARGIEWHFNPPAAPHQGGLWEAGVKSAKFHMKRVVGNACLTFEQFSTLLCQVEAVLNSRPLYAMSAEPGDYEALTPGHFLIGEPLMAVPVASVEDVARNRLNQYQQQQQRIQHFWKRWSSEYLNTLQQRNKWRWETGNVKCGDLVLVVEPTSPGQWKLGRVQEVHPGNDGLVRVVTVKTVSGEYKRSINKLVPLQINSDNE